MVAASAINVQRAETSKLQSLSFDNLPFGKYFTDHMLEADYEDGEWKNVEIKPYQPLLLDPSTTGLHYGQSIFEGIKAYKNAEGEAFIFRPYDNFKRFNTSAERMNMPAVPKELFIDGMKQLVAIDKNWIPQKKEYSLYIRPLMFATDITLGVRPSETYKFLIILSPAGPYFSDPMKILVEENYTRAAPGGVGFAKNAGNYGGSMLSATKAREENYDQVLWTDAFEHKWLQEVGMMNVMFIIDGKAVTPSLEEGTILHGVTRSSALTILKEEMNIVTEERKISIDELIEFYKKGLVTEVFGLGTAATVAMIKELRYKDFVMKFNVNICPVASEIKHRLTDIRDGKTADKYNWIVKV